MSYFLSFLFLLLTLHETHSFARDLVSLSQWLTDLLGLEAAHQPGLGALQDEPQQEVALESYEDMTPPAPEDAGDNALTAKNRSRKWAKTSKKLMARCYQCNVYLPNLNNTDGRVYYVYGIPPSTICHDAWDPSVPSSMKLIRKFRTHCYLDPGTFLVKLEQPIQQPERFDRGPMSVDGPFIGGCFKRFLDVGEVLTSSMQELKCWCGAARGAGSGDAAQCAYSADFNDELYTARGCRVSNGRRSTSGFANRRFQVLEEMLMDEKDACISSPYASLTPFSRGVSLYVRYHVCVCSGSYCNHAPAASASAPALLLVLTINLLI